MEIDSAGDVGIGSAPVAQCLSVVYNYPGKNVVTIENSSTTGYSSVDIWNSSGALASTFGYGNSGVGAPFTSTAYFNTYGHDFLVTNSGGTALFCQESTGNVGVATTTPQSQLDVAGNASFGTYGGSNAAPANGIIVSGFVGIGTASPVSNLDVAGSTGSAIKLVSTNTTLDATYSTVIIQAIHSSITFPSAASSTRRVYTIVNQTGTAQTTTSYLNFSNAATTNVPANSSITVQSDGTNWYLIKN